MGWSIDDLIWNKIRNKILKDRYAGCIYDAANGNSAVIIRHREPLSGKEMRKMAKLFPKHVRIEFQEVFFEGSRVTVYSSGVAIKGSRFLCSECNSLLLFWGTKNLGETVCAIYRCTKCRTETPMAMGFVRGVV